MARPRRSVAGLCIAVIVLAALLPGISVLDYAQFEPLWILLPDPVVVAADIPVAPCDEQTVPLFSLVPSRAPPSRPVA